MRHRTPYKLPTIVRGKDGDWHVTYHYEIPDQPGVFKPFKVRDGINYIKSPEEKEKEVKRLQEDVKYALEKQDFNPFVEHEFKSEIKRAKKEVEKTQAIMTLDKALTWVKSQKTKMGKSENTIKSYDDHVKPFVEWCKVLSPPILRIDEPNIDQIEKYLSDQFEAKKWGPRTFNNHADTITTFFNYLVAKRKLAVNPIGKGMIEPMTNRAEKNKYYDQETLNKLLPKLKDSPKLRRYILWQYYTCARGSELRALQIKHLELDKSKINISSETGKTGAHVGTRAIPICVELMEIIEAEGLKDLPGDWYLFGTKGLPHQKKAHDIFFSNRYAVIKKDLNIDSKYTIYSFKHTRVVDLLVAGFDPIKVMYITGHTDWASFQKYIRELSAVMDKQLIGTTIKLGI